MSKRIYSCPTCRQFVRDMEAAGLTVEHYEGRNSWKGPSVIVPRIQDALSETKVKCQWDSMGLEFVVYPVNSDAGREAG